MHFVLDQIYPTYSKLYQPSQVQQNLTHANTLTNTLTKTRTNTWPTDTPVTTCTFSYTPVHTNTPNLHHKYTHECADTKRPQNNTYS